VLVVDDDLAIGEVFYKMLSPDHDVRVFTRARDALAAIANGSRFDIILCDMMMPIVTGPDFLRGAAAAVPEQAERVVFLTGGAFTTGAREFLDRVPNGRLDKPIPAASSRVGERAC